MGWAVKIGGDVEWMPTDIFIAAMARGYDFGERGGPASAGVVVHIDWRVNLRSWRITHENTRKELRI